MATKRTIEILIAVALVSACGGKGDDSQSVNPSPVPTSNSNPPPANVDQPKDDNGDSGDNANNVTTPAESGAALTDTQKDPVIKDVVDEQPPAVACQTYEEIKAHTETGRSRLVVDGVALANINTRFCVHTAEVGTQNILSGNMLRQAVAPGLQVAIADVRRGEFGATFDEAQLACAALTLNGKRWSVPASGEEEKDARTIAAGSSLESVGPYFFGPNEDWRSTMFWSASANARYPNYAWVFSGITGKVCNADRKVTYGVRCIAR